MFLKENYKKFIFSFIAVNYISLFRAMFYGVLVDDVISFRHSAVYRFYGLTLYFVVSDYNFTFTKQ